jgi:hypothetical protein
MPCGFNFHRDDGRYYLLRALVKLFICAFLACVSPACVSPACVQLKERIGSSLDAGSEAPLFLKIYQGPLNHLSAVRRGDCPMYPSCSEFSGQAIATHGAIVGWMMTFDRLLRCGRDELNMTPRVFDGGRLKAYDTVEDNDFWWASPQKSSPP